MALAAAVAAVALVACGGSKSTATTTTTDPQALQKYVTAVRNAVDEAEQKIAVAVDGPDNNYGIGTVSAAYHALVATLQGLTVPPTMAAANSRILAEANGIAREADSIGKLPTANNERDIRKEQLAERRQRFQANASSLGT
jgi:hypothetical protein